MWQGIPNMFMPAAHTNIQSIEEVPLQPEHILLKQYWSEYNYSS